MTHHGFLRVAAAVPALRVADCPYNAERILGLMARAEAEQVSVLVFPELSLTAYTCADLFQQTALQRGALTALGNVVAEGKSIFSGLAVVGLPIAVDDQMFNCAALICQGRVLGVVPKSFIPNYKEFYEGRWFAAAATARSTHVVLNGQTVPFGTRRLFDATNVEGLIVGIEVCEDLWVPVPPSSFQAAQGATLLLNLSASNEVIGKAAYRRRLVVHQSATCLAAYVYAGSGVWESTTDMVFGGHCLIAENGVLLAESERFQREETLLTCDIDIDRLRAERIRTNSFGDLQLYLGLDRPYDRVPFRLERPPLPQKLARRIEAHPFVPSGEERLRERCEEIFQTQVAGLARRLEHLQRPPVSIGISGGLDSTLALLVACRTMDALDVPRTEIRAFTFPGFGTTQRTHGNARKLMEQLGVSAAEVDIRRLCLDEMRALGHRPFGIELDDLSDEALTARLAHLPADQCVDLTFENVQARMRTSLLMNSGFVIGTGDLSELALGWCTYNADQMSMYNPNVSIPKTLVKFLVRWAAQNEFTDETQRVLLDIVDTEISPELLPSTNGEALQSTERVIGPYELHDFSLFHFMRYGAPPEKILYLARQARFERPYSQDEIRKWLRVFLERFFANQFKRSCMPDGPKVGSVSLSPRGDWRMPSDADVEMWLKSLGDEKPQPAAATAAGAK